MVLLAVGYRCHPVFIWDPLEPRLLGTCRAEIFNNGINDMVFNPSPDIPALVVSYQNGGLCVFDYTTMQLHHERLNMFASSLSCSADGRSLAIGNSEGVVEVYEFERSHDGTSTSLTLLYRTSRPAAGEIEGISLSLDGQRFVDICGEQWRAWAPAALVRRFAGELESSIGSEVKAPFPERESEAGGVLQDADDQEITSPLTMVPGKDFVVAGKRNGEVGLFSTVDATRLSILYQHPGGASVVSVSLSTAEGIIASADSCGRVLVARIKSFTPQEESQDTSAMILLDRRFGGCVEQVLLNSTADRVLVCGRQAEQLWDIQSLRGLLPETTAAGSRSTSPGQGFPTPGNTTTRSRSVFQHPANPKWYVVVTGDTARVFSWADAAEVTSVGIQLERDPPDSEPKASTATEPRLPCPVSYHVVSGGVVEHFRASDSVQSRAYLWRASVFDPTQDTGPARPSNEPNLSAIGPRVLNVLGMTTSSTLVFLDVNLWVCSVELQSLILPSPPTRKRVSSACVIRRHFFALNEWRNRQGYMSGALAVASSESWRGGRPRDVVAFANRHQVVVIKGGLEITEGEVVISTGGVARGAADSSNASRLH